jgi:hypothetical protein
MLTMLRLASPDLVLAGAQPAPVGVVLASEPMMLEAAEPEPLTRESKEKVIATPAQERDAAAIPSSENVSPSVLVPKRRRNRK